MLQYCCRGIAGACTLCRASSHMMCSIKLVHAYISDVSIDVPEELDISFLKGKGLQPGEEEFPKSSGTSETKQGALP